MIKTILKIVIFMIICIVILFIIGSIDTNGYSWISAVLMFIVFKLMFRRKREYTKGKTVNKSSLNLRKKKNIHDKSFYSINRTKIIIAGIGILAILLTVIYAKNKRKYYTSDELVNTSFKELKNSKSEIGRLENLDTVYNLYSNFKYGVTYDGPDNWKYDLGASKHSLYTTYERDSAISFNIIVLDLKVDKTKQHNIWDLYQDQKLSMDSDFKKMIGINFNSDITVSKGTKTYIKNNVALRREIDYTLKDLDYIQENKMICYQTFRNGNNYTFALDVPLIFYEKNKSYYENFFAEVNWLKNQEELDKYINDFLDK